MENLTIAIIGAGFSGVATAANIVRYANRPCNIILFEKTGEFGAGDAYRTSYPFHLLNVRAKDMSVYEDDPDNFVAWLNKNMPTENKYHDQFVPRMLYRRYLHDTLTTIPVGYHASEVVDVFPFADKIQIITKDLQTFVVDKVVLALGNNPPNKFPFLVAPDVSCINNPWDYTAVKQIAKQDPVLIVGTGLSMIDAVLTLHHQQHTGKIYALSRHGLLPLRHSDNKDIVEMQVADFPKKLSGVVKHLRQHAKNHTQKGGDWRSVIGGFRKLLSQLWQQADDCDKKRFLRHVLAYWNIQRHRVTESVIDCLERMIAENKLEILSGRVAKVTTEYAEIKLRSGVAQQFKINWLINCMGPATNMLQQQAGLLKTLIEKKIACVDELNTGLKTNHDGKLINAENNAALSIYALGSLRKGEMWGANSVPDIRQQCYKLAKHLVE